MLDLKTRVGLVAGRTGASQRLSGGFIVRGGWSSEGEVRSELL
jgi:hypothetical protein